MKNLWVKSVISVLIIIFSIIFCKENLQAEIDQKYLVFNDLSFNEDSSFNDIAKLISAKPLSEKSPLLAISNTREYKKYSDDINSAWTNFENKHLNLVDEWISEHPTTECGENLFYPFSGPDVLHALKYYPQAKTIQMFALERLGGIPRPDIKNPEKEVKKLYSVLDAIRASLDYHYFITSYMSGDVGENEYSGVVGLMLFALGRLEMTILDVYPVTVNKEGHLEKMPEDSIKKASSVAIFFKKPGESKPRVVVYFKGDASDSGLVEKPELIRYLKGLTNYTTLLKAASYLMYDRTFDDMRTQILSQSKCVLSESSGIPYHYLANGNWDVTLYGVYKGPLVHFKNRFDPYLYEAMKNNAEPLPFDYGYRRGKGLSHIIFARRKEGFSVYEPKYDGSSSVGEMTSWNNGQYYRVFKPFEKDIEGRLKYDESGKGK